MNLVTQLLWENLAHGRAILPFLASYIQLKKLDRWLVSPINNDKAIKWITTNIKTTRKMILAKMTKKVTRRWSWSTKLLCPMENIEYNGVT